MPRQSATAEIYAAYPLTILSRNRKKEIGKRTKMKTIGLRYLRGLCSGFPRLQAQARPCGAATVHSSLKSDCACGHEHRHWRPMTFAAAALFVRRARVFAEAPGEFRAEI